MEEIDSYNITTLTTGPNLTSLVSGQLILIYMPFDVIQYEILSISLEILFSIKCNLNLVKHSDLTSYLQYLGNKK